MKVQTLQSLITVDSVKGCTNEYYNSLLTESDNGFVSFKKLNDCIVVFFEDETSLYYNRSLYFLETNPIKKGTLVINPL